MGRHTRGCADLRVLNEDGAPRRGQISQKRVSGLMGGRSRHGVLCRARLAPQSGGTSVRDRDARRQNVGAAFSPGPSDASACGSARSSVQPTVREADLLALIIFIGRTPCESSHDGSRRLLLYIGGGSWAGPYRCTAPKASLAAMGRWTGETESAPGLQEGATLQASLMMGPVDGGNLPLLRCPLSSP